MKALVTRAFTAGALVTGSLAVAPPALAACEDGWMTLAPRTVGVAGEDVATTPGIIIRRCGTVDPPESVPTPRVERYGAIDSTDFAIFLDFPEGEVGAGDWVIAVEVDGDYTEVPISTDHSMDGGSICLFFNGWAYSNPGGCVLYLER